MADKRKTREQLLLELKKAHRKIDQLEKSKIQHQKSEKALNKSIKKYKGLEHIINHTPAIVFLWRAEEGWPVDFVTDNISNFGYSPDDFYSGRVPYADIIHPEDLARVADEVASFSGEEGRKSFRQEYRIITKEGEVRWTDDRTWIRRNEHSEITHFQGIVLDITETKEAEKALEESETKYRAIFEHTGTGIVIIGENNRISLVNTEFEKLSGFSKEKLKNRVWMDLVVKEDLVRMKDYRKLRLSDPNSNVAPEHYECRLIDADKNIKNVFATITIIPGTNQILASIIDITARKQAENQVKRSLEEKEMLLKEIHHRVKNNLMVISSLLNLQSTFIKDKAALNSFRESQTRANSMALIHERLYRSTDLKRINFGDYIRTLAIELFHTYVADPSRVDLNLDVDDLMLDINTTVPLGLIVNELVSNCMKHAFPEGKSGEINIDFHKIDDYYVLKVCDTGMGFPEEIDFRKTETLGLQLVNNLVGQIDGTIKLDKTQGTGFTIKFKELEL